MNFIEQFESTGIQLELKYCERCGGLFLRPSTSEHAYCGNCEARWVKLIDPQSARARFSRERKVRSSGSAHARNKKSRHHIVISELRGCSLSEVLPC